MQKLLWIDLEMSGLDPEKCRILEVAAIISDLDFQTLESFHCILFQPQEVLDAMDEWCKSTHGKSGLVKAVQTGIPEAEAEQQFLKFLDKQFTKNDRILLCGNSITQDRRFIEKYWPRVEKRLHYRMIDVSSYKEIFRLKYKIEYKKNNTHRAEEDIIESMNELQHYLQFVKIP